MSHRATVLSSWAKAIRRTLESRGIDCDPLFRQAGLDLGALDDPNARYPVEHTTRLWRLAVSASGDPCLGLAVASQVAPTTFHALGFAVLASASVGEMLQRVVRYFRMATDASWLELRQSAEAIELVGHPYSGGSEAPAPESVDAFISLLIRTARGLAGRDLTPLRVELRRSKPAGTDCHSRILRAPVIFDAEDDLVAFARADCERPLDSGNVELARRSDEIIAQYLQNLAGGTLSLQVRDRLVRMLPEGEPSADQVASSLHLSLRSLQRRLAEEDSSYEQLLLQTREELARSYLQDPRHAISEIAYLLGYADASCFTRAFRRWTGMAPSVYRAGGLRDQG